MSKKENPLTEESGGISGHNQFNNSVNEANINIKPNWPRILTLDETVDEAKHWLDLTGTVRANNEHKGPACNGKGTAHTVEFKDAGKLREFLKNNPRQSLLPDGYRYLNLATIPGNEHVFLDVDDKEVFMDFLGNSGIEFPDTWTWMAGRGPVLVYRIPSGMTVVSGEIVDGNGKQVCEVFTGNSKWVQVPGSWHYASKNSPRHCPYEWLEGLGPDEIEIAEFTEDLNSLVQPSKVKKQNQQKAASSPGAKISEGGRHNFIVSTDGRLRGSMTEEERMDYFRGVNSSRFVPPYSEEELEDEVSGVHRQYPPTGAEKLLNRLRETKREAKVRKGPSVNSGAHSKPTTCIDDQDDWGWDDSSEGDGEPSSLWMDGLFQKTRPIARRVVDPFLGEGSLGMIYGDRGAAKTYLVHLLCLAVATGHEFLGHPVRLRGRVAIIDGEMDDSEIQTRLKALARALGLDDTEIDALQDRIKVISRVDLLKRDFVMPSLNSPPWRKLLLQAIESEHRKDPFRLVVFDNLSSLVGGTENGAEDWDTMLDLLLPLRSLNAASLCVHHAGKNGQQRGTSRREDVLDYVMKIERLDLDRNDFKWSFEKRRSFSPRDTPVSTLALDVYTHVDRHGNEYPYRVSWNRIIDPQARVALVAQVYNDLLNRNRNGLKTPTVDDVHAEITGPAYNLTMSRSTCGRAIQDARKAQLIP